MCRDPSFARTRRARRRACPVVGLLGLLALAACEGGAPATIRDGAPPTEQTPGPDAAPPPGDAGTDARPGTRDAAAPGADAEVSPPADAAPPSADAIVEPPEDRVVLSMKARVRFKDGTRYARDLAAGLALPPDALCRELGTRDCVEVHRIVLGGVEPYRLGIREPLPRAPLTAPIAADRVALAACTERVRRDVETPADAVLLTDPAGQPPDAWRRAVAARIYDRVLRRDAEPHEVEALVGLHAEVETEHGGPGPEATRDWTILTCFAVATSLEALFY